MFERLGYLPGDLAYRILRRAVTPSGVLPVLPLILHGIAFWPRWEFRRTRDLGAFKEPDIVLEFRDANGGPQVLLVGEAKLPGGAQDASQWAGEWLSLIDRAEAAPNLPAVFLLAIDGLPAPLEVSRTALEQEANEILVRHGEAPALKSLACTWLGLLRAMLAETASVAGDHPVRRIAADLVRAFDLHGIWITTWLSELPGLARVTGTWRPQSMPALEVWLGDLHRIPAGGPRQLLDIVPFVGSLPFVSPLSLRTLARWRIDHA